MMMPPVGVEPPKPVEPPVAELLALVPPPVPCPPDVVLWPLGPNELPPFWAEQAAEPRHTRAAHAAGAVNRSSFTTTSNDDGEEWFPASPRKVGRRQAAMSARVMAGGTLFRRQIWTS
jgi:hypothetical protein